MTLRVLHICRRFYPYVGGIESVVLGASQVLIRRGHVSDVLTLRSPTRRDAALPPEDTLGGIHITRVGAVGPGRYRVAPAVLRHLEGYDVLHVHSLDFFTDYLAWTKPIHRKPLVISTHGGIFHTPWLKRLKRCYFHSLTRLALGRAEVVMCDSRHDVDLFKQIVPAEKLRLVRNGVDTSRFGAIKKDIQPGLLVGIGRVAENKGIDRLLHVLARLPAGARCTRLVWVGADAGDLATMQREARALGLADRVRFVGEVDQATLCEYLAQAHLFVSASTYEAFGVSTVEAMSSGTVPFVSPTGIHPELIRDGQNGFLVAFDALELVAARLEEALALPTERLLQMGRQAQRDAHALGWDVVIEQYLEIYRALCR
jgi:alpha-1,3-mannosyltransferase